MLIIGILTTPPGRLNTPPGMLNTPITMVTTVRRNPASNFPPLKVRISLCCRKTEVQLTIRNHSLSFIPRRTLVDLHLIGAPFILQIQCFAKVQQVSVVKSFNCFIGVIFVMYNSEEVLVTPHTSQILKTFCFVYKEIWMHVIFIMHFYMII